VQLRILDELQAFFRQISDVLKETIPNHHRVIGISTNTSIGPNYTLDLVTYLIVTAKVRLPDAV